jgi:hypothetical protein
LKPPINATPLHLENSQFNMKLRMEVEGGSICNFAAAIVDATVEVEVEVSVLEVFPFSQLTSLSVFSGCESSIGASLL